MKTNLFLMLLFWGVLCNVNAQVVNPKLCLNGKYYRTTLDTIKLNDQFELNSETKDSLKYEKWKFNKKELTISHTFLQDSMRMWIGTICEWKYNKTSSELKVVNKKRIIFYSVLRCEKGMIELKKISEIRGRVHSIHP